MRRDGSFVALPPHDPAVLEAAWRPAVLGWFVRRGGLEEDASARYGARTPVAESRLRYDAERAEVERVSDRSEGPYAGIHRLSALEFIARLVDHVPERYEVRVRYYGAYARRRRATGAAGGGRRGVADSRREVSARGGRARRGSGGRNGSGARRHPGRRLGLARMRVRIPESVAQLMRRGARLIAGP